MKTWTDKVSQLRWQKLDKLSGLVLAVLILWLCWKLASLFWWMIAPPQAMQFDRVELGSQQAQVPNISAFALFNEPRANTAAQDNVNLELQGVLVGRPNYLSSAVIKLNDKAERYRVGETIESTSYQLAEVYWDHVLLRQGNGATREVRFKGLDKGLYQPMEPVSAPPPAAAPSAPAQQAAPQSALGQAIQQMQDNREQYLKNMGISGGTDGYEISDRTPTNLKNTLGLRSGDRILSVNGQPVGQGVSDVQLLEQVRREGHAKIEIKRGDQVMTIQQSF